MCTGARSGPGAYSLHQWATSGAGMRAAEQQTVAASTNSVSLSAAGAGFRAPPGSPASSLVFVFIV
jgi:hypothetical protein